MRRIVVNTNCQFGLVFNYCLRTPQQGIYFTSFYIHFNKSSIGTNMINRIKLNTNVTIRTNF